MTAKKIKTGKQEFWRAEFRYRHANGTLERFRLRSPVNTKRGCEEFERQVRQELQAGTYKGQKSSAQEQEAAKTFDEYAGEFMRTYAKVNNKPSEICSKEKNLRLYLKPYFGAMALGKIGTKHVEAFKASMLEKDYKVKTINNALATLSIMFNVAVDWDEVSVCPKIKNMKRGEDKKINFLTTEQASKLVNELKGSLRAMVTFGLNTGLRVGEMRALYWDDIDLKTGKMVVRRNLWKSQLGHLRVGAVGRLSSTQRL